ncbi:MAG: hypothetical protein O3B21_03040 [Proteobacteria bacterium]|nr:hypothetical protein [Pseudomonadota bacterium]MDA1354774.1 hypothetical protein [Pseudomonadota bacterium]
MKRSAQLLTILLCAVVLAACGDLPRPFQPVDKASPEALEEAFGPRAGVFVEPIPGMPEADSARLSGDLVLALRALDVAAGRHASNRASYRISAEPGTAGAMRWSLAEPSGKVIFRFDDHGDADRAAIVAQSFAAILNPAPPAPASAGLSLAVQPVDGAPGDGRQALTQAMRQALVQSGFISAESLENASFIVLGSVYVAEAPDSHLHQSITVDWAVLTADGVRIGTVSQSNVLPLGALDGGWGEIARVVAENGAQGIVAMLARVGALE